MVQLEGPVRGLAALLLVIYNGCLVLLNIAVQRLRKGAGVLTPSRRPRPAVLDDPALGTHHTAALSTVRSDLRRSRFC